MAHLWMRGEAAGDGGRVTARGWLVRELTGETEYFPETRGREAKREPDEGTGPTTVFLMRAGTSGDEFWTVIGSDSVLVNGDPLLLGIRVLSDRDEVRVEGEPSCYFSTERLARIETFPGGNRITRCGRCKQKIDQGTPAVRCPQCGIWYHQVGSDLSEEDALPCWTYRDADKCATCQQPNRLDAGYQWSPEEL